MQRYTVSSLVKEIDGLLRARYPAVLVEAEVAELSLPGSGHAFLRLADAGASISAVAWRSDWRGFRYRPAQGDRVLIVGRLALYGPRGAFQLYVRDIRPAGLGAMAKELAERRARLEAEGLLDPRRKRPLPPFPSYVGVATALKGAALQDFLRVSGERWPASRILVASCLVQGARAPADILRAVELLLEDGRSEVIVVTRGGGAAEDLMAFQDEQLARILAHSPVPLVSAVGHEVDTTLCDLVADVVVPTPTAAAVRVLPDGPALASRVEEWRLRLELGLARRLERQRARVVDLRGRLRHPARRLDEVRTQARDQRERLGRLIARSLAERRAALISWTDRLERAAAPGVGRARERVQSLEARLHALSPLAVLERGYAVVRTERGVLTHAEHAAPGDGLRVRLAQGELHARVIEPPDPG